MRKINPADVRAGFRADADSLMAFLNRTRRAIEAEGGTQADVSQLAEMVFLDLYVAFERFLSDLFLAYLNGNFTQYQAALSSRVTQSIAEKYGQWAQGRVRFDTVQHVSVDDLESIIDPDGWNLTFKSAQMIRQKASDWLVPAHRNRVTGIDVHDERVIDTSRAIRDFIAHQSRGAKAKMNASLGTVTHGQHNRYLGRGTNEIHNAGAFLKAVFDGQRRIAIYSIRLKDIAARM